MEKQLKTNIKQYGRKAVFAELKTFCIFAAEHDFIEVCEWKNGEGFDVEIGRASCRERV
jgi:hypothetical protein